VILPLDQVAEGRLSGEGRASGNQGVAETLMIADEFICTRRRSGVRGARSFLANKER